MKALSPTSLSTESKQESTSIVLLLLAAATSTLAVWALWWVHLFPVEISGQWSISTLLMIVCAWPALISFGFGYFNNRRLSSTLARLTTIRRWLHLAGLSLAFALFFAILGLLTGLFIRQAFVDWTPDPIAISLIAGFSSAIASYVTVQLASQINTINLLQIGVLFLGLGICSSMLLNDDPHWWQRSFSYLGDLEGNTFWLFSFTLVVAGVLLLSISDFISHDLELLAQDDPSARSRIGSIKLLFVALAISMSLVGLVPNVVGEVWGLLHNILARIMLAIYFVLIIGSRWLLPELSRIFQTLSVVIIGLVAFFYLLLYRHWQYLNVVTFELLSFFVCLGWLYLFVQTIMVEAATKRDKESRQTEV